MVAGWTKSGILNFSKFWRNVAESISAGKVRWPDLYYAVERSRDRHSPAFALASGGEWGWLFFTLSYKYIPNFQEIGRWGKEGRTKDRVFFPH